MITIKINSDITVYVDREPGESTYEVISSDSEGHELNCLKYLNSTLMCDFN